MARNVVNIEEVSKAFDIRPLLERVSLEYLKATASELSVAMALVNPR